jgi:hypothetical protein
VGTTAIGGPDAARSSSRITAEGASTASACAAKPAEIRSAAACTSRRGSGT